MTRRNAQADEVRGFLTISGTNRHPTGTRPRKGGSGDDVRRAFRLGNVEKCRPSGIFGLSCSWLSQGKIADKVHLVAYIRAPESSQVMEASC